MASNLENPEERTPPQLSLRGIVKRYGGLEALSEVNLDVHDREAVALVGDNGAGKSTLVKIISGVEQPDAGKIIVRGQDVQMQTPRDSHRHGIATLHQTLGLVEVFGVAQNIFLGREVMGRFSGLPFMRNREMRRQTQALLERLGIRLPSLDQPVSTLSGGQRQAVAISRLLLDEVSLIILDEPMAALGVDEGQKVLNLISTLAGQGISILMISHNLEHVLNVADRIAVLKNGRLVDVVRTDETTREEITSLIVYGQR